VTGNWTSKVRCLPFFLSAARQERSDAALLVLPPATPVAGVQALGIWDRSLRALILPQGRAAANVAKSYGRPAGREVRRGRPLPVALSIPLLSYAHLGPHLICARCYRTSPRAQDEHCWVVLWSPQ